MLIAVCFGLFAAVSYSEDAAALQTGSPRLLLVLTVVVGSTATMVRRLPRRPAPSVAEPPLHYPEAGCCSALGAPQRRPASSPDERGLSCSPLLPPAGRLARCAAGGPVDLLRALCGRVLPGLRTRDAGADGAGVERDADGRLPPPRLPPRAVPLRTVSPLTANRFAEPPLHYPECEPFLRVPASQVFLAIPVGGGKGWANACLAGSIPPFLLLMLCDGPGAMRPATPALKPVSSKAAGTRPRRGSGHLFPHSSAELAAIY